MISAACRGLVGCQNIVTEDARVCDVCAAKMDPEDVVLSNVPEMCERCGTMEADFEVPDRDWYSSPGSTIPICVDCRRRGRKGPLGGVA